MKIKTSELEGAALDWAVAKAEGWDDDTLGALARQYEKAWPCNNQTPTTDWRQGGPLIEKYISNLIDVFGDWYAEASEGMYGKPLDQFDGHGPTALIAAMRAIVASELGDEVDIPKELIK